MKHLELENANSVENPVNPKIVIIDDNRDNLRVLTGILKNAGYCALPISKGKMVLKSIITNPPDLILLNVETPGIDSFSICRQLKGNDPKCHVPVIFISAMDELEKKLMAFDAGGADYITTPFNETEVLARVNNHLKLFHAKKALILSEMKNRRLEKARSLERMAGAIAHKFNNHLHGVLGNIELAMEYLSDPQKASRMLVAAMKCAQQASETSLLMQTCARQTNGDFQAIDLSVFCKRYLPLLRKILPENTILKTDFPSMGPFIKGSTKLLGQILNHLVNNATEAMGKKRGIIRLSVKTVTPAYISDLQHFPVDWHPNDTLHACLEIIDQGKGISEADMENIFDPFFSTHFTGRGLGLPVSLGIAGTHGGGIAVESNPGKGSTFRVLFPVYNEEKSLSPDPGVRKNTRHVNTVDKRAILVVDDEAAILSLISDYLENTGYNVITAENGIKAIEAFKQRKNEIKCVLTDLSMPGLSGWETISELRRISQDLYIILSSGYDESRVISPARGEERPQDFLRKPYDLATLARTVEKAYQ